MESDLSIHHRTDMLLRTVDSCIILIDDDIEFSTQLIIERVLMEKCHPIFFVNKLDQLVETMSIEGLSAKITQINEKLCRIYKKFELDASGLENNIIYGSAKFGWGFTLDTCRSMYTKRINSDREILLEKFWGEKYFDPKDGTWETDDQNGTLLEALPLLVTLSLLSVLLVVLRASFRKSVEQKCTVFELSSSLSILTL
jgi:translation elongation factor EF-G